MANPRYLILLAIVAALLVFFAPVGALQQQLTNFTVEPASNFHAGDAVTGAFKLNFIRPFPLNGEVTLKTGLLEPAWNYNVYVEGVRHAGTFYQGSRVTISSEELRSASNGGNATIFVTFAGTAPVVDHPTSFELLEACDSESTSHESRMSCSIMGARISPAGTADS